MQYIIIDGLLEIRSRPNHIYDFSMCLADIEASGATSNGDAAQSCSKAGTKPRIVTSSDHSLSCGESSGIKKGGTTR